MFEGEADSPPPSAADVNMCLLGAPALDEGRDCQMYWAFNDAQLPSGEMLRGCDDLAFLEAVDDPTPGVSDFATAVGATHVCRVKRVANAESTDQGWYYTSQQRRRMPQTCLALTPDAPVVDNLYIWSSCPATQAIARDGSLIDSEPQLCSLPADSAKHASSVGADCQLTTIPEGGLRESTVYVETNSADCETGVCLAYRIEGDPECDASDMTSCGPGQVPLLPSEVGKRVYCSCRCDAPEGDPGDFCECGPGYSCVPALYDGPSGVRGSYCVKQGTISAL
jgi:hypothetical protein